MSVYCCAPWARSGPDGTDADGCEVAQEFRWSFTSRVHALHGSLKCQDIPFRMQMLSSVELACDRSDVLKSFHTKVGTYRLRLPRSLHQDSLRGCHLYSEFAKTVLQEQHHHACTMARRKSQAIVSRGPRREQSRYCSRREKVAGAIW